MCALYTDVDEVFYGNKSDRSDIVVSFKFEFGMFGVSSERCISEIECTTTLRFHIMMRRRRHKNLITHAIYHPHRQLPFSACAGMSKE